jgi:hypothetical protein
MRLTWSADRALAVVAAASLEGAWLTLLYVLIQWWAGQRDLPLGIGHFAVGAGVGILLARRLGRWSPRWFASAVIATSVAVGGLGVWLAVAPSMTLVDLGSAVARHPGGWLLGIAVLRGTAHGEPDDESIVAERLLGRGVPGLAAFWIVAAISGLARATQFELVAFAATLTFVTAALVSLGLGRLSDLDVEAADPAPTRWLGLLLGVCVLFLAVGIPLAAVLGLPVQTALAGVAGPVAPLLAAFFTVLAIPVGFILEVLIGLLNGLGGGRLPPPPAPIASAAASAAQPIGLPGTAPDLSLLLWIALAACVVLGLAAVAAFLRRPSMDVAESDSRDVRETEPIVMGPLPRLPRIRLPSLWPNAPTSAVEAYHMALASLVGSNIERRLGETPKEHAKRVAGSGIGPSLGRLAADYQLSALAGRQLSAIEERRAVARWRRIIHRSS